MNLVSKSSTKIKKTRKEMMTLILKTTLIVVTTLILFDFKVRKITNENFEIFLYTLKHVPRKGFTIYFIVLKNVSLAKDIEKK
jgi:hypothetical protein